LRAGLLSDPEVIARLNNGFVCTSIIIDDLQKLATSGDALAKRIVGQWEYPVEFIFLKPDGTMVSRMNSFNDFPGMHPDVSAPPGHQHQALMGERTHSDVFLGHLDFYFPKE
jgi:hypothetical protein